jgi:hypothetical protein
MALGAAEVSPERQRRLDRKQVATLRFKLADAQRSGKHVEQAQMSYRPKKHEADIFSAWTIEQIQAGAPPAELTWGRCVEALGLHDPLVSKGRKDE